MTKLKSSYSSFWLDKSMFLDEDKYEVTSDVERRSNDIMKLVSYKRAVSNFVNIVTGMPIRVTFDERGTDSYTDGKEVVISSKMDDGEFDPVVGLALHEGSHIKLTDFETLRKMTREDFLPSTIDVEYLKERFGLETQGSICVTIYDKLKDLLNVVEDRRIDNFIFTTAPGYRGYYEAMYDKYFNAKIIDKGLQSAEYRDETWDSYMFRIVNITNPNRDLDALNGLRDIWNVLDLRNISRLKTSWDALEVAGQIFMIVQKSIDAAKQDESGEGEEPNQEEMNGSSDMSGDMDNESPNQGMNSNTQVQGEPTDGGDDSDSQPEQLTANQIEQLRKAIEKQKKFQEGDIQKKKLNRGEKRKVDVLEKSDIDIQVTGKNLNEWSNYKNGGTQTYVVRNFTKDLVDTNQFSILTNSEWRAERNIQNIQKGIQMGILLGKKLKTRSEERSLITPRMKSGKLSGRMIHEIGFGNFDIFERTMVNKSKPAIIHISIDASGSMGGDKWNNTQVAAIAIAKAASMTQNLDVVITYRSTTGQGNDYLPFILVAYDSRKDKFNKIQNLFHYIQPNGTTPEGLCFEAILKDIVSYSKGADAYFVNFSDGCPTFSNNTISYEGDSAFKHTADQVKKIRQSGVNVLSYFISEGYMGYDADNFRKMYGSDANFIDVTELTPLAKSLNSKFEANLTI
jgi:hypothetical protein